MDPTRTVAGPRRTPRPTALSSPRPTPPRVTSAVQPPSHSDPDSWLLWRTCTVCVLVAGSALVVLFNAESSDLGAEVYAMYLGFTIGVGCVMVPWLGNLRAFRIGTALLTILGLFLCVFLLSPVPLLFCLPYWCGSLMALAGGPRVPERWTRGVTRTVYATGGILVGLGVIGFAAIDLDPKVVYLCRTNVPGQSEFERAALFDMSQAGTSRVVEDESTSGYTTKVYLSHHATGPEIEQFQQDVLRSGLAVSVSTSASAVCR